MTINDKQPEVFILFHQSQTEDGNIPSEKNDNQVVKVINEVNNGIEKPIVAHNYEDLASNRAKHAKINQWYIGVIIPLREDPSIYIVKIIS